MSYKVERAQGYQVVFTCDQCGKERGTRWGPGQTIVDPPPGWLALRCGERDIGPSNEWVHFCSWVCAGRFAEGAAAAEKEDKE